MKTDINADEIRAIVAKMREEGRITDAKPKYRTPSINPAPSRLAMMNTRLRWCGAPTSAALNTPHVAR